MFATAPVSAPLAMRAVITAPRRGPLSLGRSVVRVRATLEADATAEPPTPAAPRKRRLVLLRHAEAEPRAETDENDRDRALTARGRAHAVSWAKNLATKPPHWSCPELLLVSDSARTKETLSVMEGHLPGLKEARVIYVPEFYDHSATGSDALAAIMAALREKASEADATVLCLGHNAGWEECSTTLAGEPVVLKTAQAALLKSSARTWAEVVAPESESKWVLMAKLSYGEKAASKAGASAAAPESKADAPQAQPASDDSLAAKAAKKAAQAAAKAAAALKAADDGAAAPAGEQGEAGVQGKRVKARKPRRAVAAAAPEEAAVAVADVPAAKPKASKKKMPVVEAAAASPSPVDEPGSGPEDGGGRRIVLAPTSDADIQVSISNGSKKKKQQQQPEGVETGSKAGNAKRKALESAASAQWSLAKASAGGSAR